MEYQITREAFYLHHALKVLKRGGYDDVKVYYHRTVGTPYLVMYYGQDIYIRNININSIEASVQELYGLYMNKFLLPDSQWSKISSLESFVMIEELLLTHPRYKDTGVDFFTAVTKDAYAIVVEYTPHTPA